MMSYLPFFQQFAPIKEEDYALLANRLHQKEFKKGEYILRPGQTQRYLYLVASGVQMSFYESEKHLNVMAFTYAPSLCAMPESFSLQQESEGYLLCLTESRFMAIDFDAL